MSAVRPRSPAAAPRCLLGADRADALARVAFGAPRDGADCVVPAPRLGGSEPIETWTAGRAARPARLGAFAARDDGASVFAWAEAEAGRADALEEAARELYREALRALAADGRAPLRFWNYVPRINEDEDGVERYKRFCRGRSLAFEDAYGADFPARLPAASAVGAEGTRLVVCFLASRLAAEQFENPRQVSAYDYPARYGPRSPSFARATAAGGAVFVSGTASVVGHETRHAGNADAQLEETLRNLEALLARIDPAAPGEDPLRRFETLRVYVRRAADAPRLEAALAARLGAGAPTLLLRADICRAELLLEIEGTARRPRR